MVSTAKKFNSLSGLKFTYFSQLVRKKQKNFQSLYSWKWHGALNLSLFSSPPSSRSLLTLERISIVGHLKALGKQITFSTLELSKKTAMGFLSDFFPLMVPIFLLSYKKNYFSFEKSKVCGILFPRFYLMLTFV